MVCITLGFFPNSASGNGMWALGSGISKKNGLGNGTGTPPSGPSTKGQPDVSISVLNLGSSHSLCMSSSVWPSSTFSKSYYDI